MVNTARETEPVASPKTHSLDALRGRRFVFGNTTPSREERRADWRPNPHAALPTPARSRVVSLLRDLRGDLALMGVVNVGVFGSVARGDDTPSSDVDVAAHLIDANLFLSKRVRDLLERHFDRHVDLATLPFGPLLQQAAGPDLVMVW